MSLIFPEVENPHNCKPGPYHGAAGIVRASIDPATYDQMPFPNDYKYFSSLWPRKYVDWAERFRNFKVRSDDVWVLGFPKSGTTWIHNIVSQLITNHHSTTDFIGPNFNYFEGPILFDDDQKYIEFVKTEEKLFKALDTIPSPRMIKSHLPAFLLPKEIWTVRPKLIYMSREVKDVAVSYFHMTNNCEPLYEGSAHEFFFNFYHDYIVMGPYYEHIKSFHQLRHLNHLLVMTYEEMSANTLKSVKQVNDFMECSYSDEQLNRLIERVSFKNMRGKIEFTSENAHDPDFIFCRKGKVGGYRDEMTEEDIRNFDEWTARKKKELEMD